METGRQEIGAGFLDRRFRVNRSYELVLLDRLTAAERFELRGADDGDVYGILRPRSGGRFGVRTVSPETALLCLTLATPSVIPRYVRMRMGGDCPSAIWRLVLDEILEVESASEFVSGAAACERPPAVSALPSRIAQLAIEALQYAQHLEHANVRSLAARLYRYNSLPLTGPRAQILGSADGVFQFLGLGRTDARWFVSRDWIVFPSETGRRTPARCKLYVSPHVDAVGDALARLTPMLRNRVPVYKVGATASGLLRPDKIVLYLETIDEARVLAAEIAESLRGLPAQGVPFTGVLDERGMVSLGLDPPSSAWESIWQDGESWRGWITNKLARAIELARADATARVEPWEFALAYARAAGVDTDSWIPRSDIWTDDLC